MPKPNIKWIGSPNHSSLKGYKFIAIVNHIMQGTLLGTDSWFLNPNSGASSHFGVGKNGEIHQYVDLKYPAWANGDIKNTNWSVLNGAMKGINPNWFTISIEHEGYTGDIMTEAQYQSTLALHKWLIDELGIEVNTDTIIGHYRIDSVTRARCPGTGFPWDRLFKDLTPPTSPPSPSNPTNEIYRVKVNKIQVSAWGNKNTAISEAEKQFNIVSPNTRITVERKSDNGLEYDKTKLSPIVDIPSPQPEPLNFTYPNNAKIINDDLYVRDSNGNKLLNRYVSKGDNVTILDISYSKQLVFLEYPTSSGVKSGWVSNVTNCIQYYYLNQWKNGSTKEVVYDDNGNVLGSLDPRENATPLYKKNGKLHVVYSTSKGVNSKSGFVDWYGGFSRF